MFATRIRTSMSETQSSSADGLRRGVRRERRCWCLTAVCCCKWSRPPRQSKGEKKPLPYTRLAELFAQVR